MAPSAKRMISQVRILPYPPSESNMERMTIAIVVLMIFSAAMFFAIGYGISSVENLSRRKVFNQTHEVFCKDCCWKHEDIYTCTKKKEQLWKKVN